MVYFGKARENTFCPGFCNRSNRSEWQFFRSGQVGQPRGRGLFFTIVLTIRAGWETYPTMARPVWLILPGSDVQGPRIASHWSELATIISQSNQIFDRVDVALEFDILGCAFGFGK